MDTPRMSTTPPASNPWASLLPPAMVGTDKKPFTLQPWDGAVGALLAQVQAQAGSNPAQTLLQAAGVLAACERAGQRPVNALPADPTAPGASPHGVAAPDTVQVALQDSTLIDTLRWLLTDAPQRLQIDWLQHLASKGWRLPPGLLPLALDTAQRASALRPAAAAVLGERGRWLAHHHGAWRYAAGSADSAPLDVRWQEGTLAQRVQLLREERQSQPAAARERLQTAWPDLPAKERAELLAVLQTGLSASDEDLLTTIAHKDKGREVRQTARTLLVQLPGSAISQRACQRLAPCLTLQTGLRSATGQRWAITPPEAADPDWKNEGIEAERPQHDPLGERAWWLYQLARQVPLSWWQQYTGMAPDALLLWAAKNDWADALVRAWWEVLRAAPVAAPASAASAADPASLDSPDSASATTGLWCRAFLDHWPGKAMQDTPAAVLALLPTAEREPYWQAALQAMAKPQQGALEDLLAQMVAAHAPGQCLSEALSALLVDKLSLYKPRHYHGLPLGDLCCVLHPSALPVLQALAFQHHSTQPEGSVAAALSQALHPHLPVLKALEAMRQLPHASTSARTNTHSSI